MKIPEYVKDGSLDLMLTKPVSLQFMASLRYVDLARRSRIFWLGSS